jgi:hypothetical protein
MKTMNKEEALLEFIKGLHIAFNNSLAYPREHPYFIKSVEEFRRKIEILFGFLSSVRLNITPEALFLDDRYWVKPLACVELAQILHQRKIKAIELRFGLDTNELADLLSALALSPKDVLKSGGLWVILKKAETAHIVVEELDYSELLRMKGTKEYGDIWRYLFKGAIVSKDIDKINEILESFPESLKNIDVKDLVVDDGLKRDLIDFFLYLKENNKRGFSECSNTFFDYLVSSKNALSQEEAHSLKGLFKCFNENDFADILRTQISKSDNLDPLFLNLFSMFSQGALSDKAAPLLSEHVKAGGILEKDHLAAKRIQAFLSNPDSQSVSPVYRNTLFSLLKDISYSDDLYFDPKGLRINYRFVLLNMLNQTGGSEGIKLILTILNKEWSFITEDKDYEYIRYLSQVISDKQKEEAIPLEEFDSLKNRIAVFIEESIWDENSDVNLEYLAGLLEKSRNGSQFYLDKMFQEDKISVYGLELFLKFFPVELDLFYSGVKSKQHDLVYLSRIVRIVAGLDTNLSLVILKHIYFFSNELIKAEILEAMQGLSVFDKEFLLGALKNNSRTLKEEALKVLLRENESGKAGIAVLLRAHSPWGSKNNLILENMAIIEKLNLNESNRYLIPFTKMNLFWHAPLKKKALSILEGLK